MLRVNRFFNTGRSASYLCSSLVRLLSGTADRIPSVDVSVAEANQEISSFFGEASRSPSDTSCNPFNEAGTVLTSRASSKDLPSGELSHVDASGGAVMVDTSAKREAFREAGASAKVLLGEEAFRKVKENQIKKGDVLTVSKIAGILGAKQTPHLLPLCHPVSLTGADVSFELMEAEHALAIEARCRCNAGTGVEMEALVAVGIAALNVVDMVKAVNKSAAITDLRLDFKRGGKSGDYIRQHP